MLKLLIILLVVFSFINHYFQFKLSMPKLSGTKLLILPTSFFSVYFSVVFSLWGKIPKCFFISHRAETPDSLKWSWKPLLAWFLLGTPCSCCVLVNPLCRSWVHMWFAEHAIHTASCSKFSFSCFSPGSSCKTCWFMTAFWGGCYYLPIFQRRKLKPRKFT